MEEVNLWHKDDYTQAAIKMLTLFGMSSTSSWRVYFKERARPDKLRRPHYLALSAQMAFERIHFLSGPDMKQFDVQDLIHQCLFRLFLDHPSVFVVRGKIQEAIWAGLPYDDIEGDVLEFDQSLLLAIYNEQRQLLLDRYYQPEAALFQDLSSTFNGFERGRIEVVGDNAYVTRGRASERITVGAVDPVLANRVFKSFHYMHTPCDSIHVLGLYTNHNKLPFSMLSIGSINRDYRKAALLKYDLDPEHIYQFSRLYSVPNSPRNTSSYIFGAAVTYLKNVDPVWQGSLTSFLPSYTAGSSMLSSGFESLLFTKPFHHFYERSEFGIIPGTSRTSNGEVLTNKTQILPLVELIRVRRQSASKRILQSNLLVSEG